MQIKTPTLVKNEIRMLFNQFKHTLTTPSMLAFYCITFFGALFVSTIVSSFVSFAPLFTQVPIMVESFIEREMIISTLGILTVTSIAGGYFGLGPAEVLETSDEHIMMPAPIQPHQLFISRYTRRAVRKIFYFFMGLFIIFPLIATADLLIPVILVLIISLIFFLETNYFLGGIMSTIRSRIDVKTQSKWRYIILPLAILAAYVPSLPPLSQNYFVLLAFPANQISLIIMEVTSIHAFGVIITDILILMLIGYSISFLVLANITSYEYYENFSISVSKQESESRISKKIRGEVDFSESRFDDPMMWIILKDFWSRMRTPLQFWKYIYVLFGSFFVAYLNIVRPSWLPPAPIPPQLGYASIPAFLLLIILMTQISSLTSLLSFVDERENIYLIKVSPFKSRDVVLAKYLFSVLEVAITAIPMYGLLVYFFRVEGSGFLIFLAAPMILIFCATGTMAGAYIPVFTNDPRNPPVPLAFSFPTINLIIGASVVYLSATYAADLILLVLLPTFTLFIVGIFLWLSVRALDSYR